MGKTRRKLYGKSRRRRQKGGGSRWWLLLGAVAALKGARAEEPGFRVLVSNWWNEGGWKNSKALADYLTMTPAEVPPEVLEKPTNEAVFSAPPPEQKEKVEEVVEPYLNTTVKATELKNGKTYMYNGEPIEVDTWSNQGDKIAVSIVGKKDPLVVPANATFEVVPEPEEEEEEEKEGGRKLRKTLRKKK